MFAIPKIQYNPIGFAGDTTSASAVIANIANTDSLVAGQIVSGTGIQAGSKILSKTVNSITLDKTATATNTAQTLEAVTEICFDYPPIEDTGEELNPKDKATPSLSGLNQTSVDYIEGLRVMNFRHVSATIEAKVKTFMQTWAVFGKTFRYFDDKSITSYVEYELGKREYKPKKVTGSEKYEFAFTTRRLI